MFQVDQNQCASMYEVEGAFVRRGAFTLYQSSTATDSTHGFASAHTGLHVCVSHMHV